MNNFILIVMVNFIKEDYNASITERENHIVVKFNCKSSALARLNLGCKSDSRYSFQI